MKKITLLLSFIACVLMAQAQSIVSDDFNYTANTALTANGWVGTGTSPSTTNPIQVTASTITYSGYPGSGTGNEVSMMNNGQDVNKSFTAITSGFIYFSALVNFSAAQTGDYFLHIGDAPTGSTFFGRVFAKLNGTQVAVGIVSTSQPAVGGVSPTPVPTYSSTLCDLNTTYLLVAKVNVSTGESSLIVNPAIGTNEPTTDQWSVNTWGTSALPTAGFKTINLRQGSATTAPTLKLDGIRVSTSWAALFTTTGLSTPSANILDVKVVGNKLTVSNAQSSTVEIFNALGAKVQSVELVNNSAELNLTKGLYIVRLGKQTAKIML